MRFLKNRDSNKRYTTIDSIPTKPIGAYDYSYPIPKPIDVSRMETTNDRAHNGSYHYIDSAIHWHRAKSENVRLHTNVSLPDKMYHDKCISTLLPGRDSLDTLSHVKESFITDFHRRDYQNLLQAREYQKSLQDRYQHTKPTYHNSEPHSSIVENPDMAKLYLYDV